MNAKVDGAIKTKSSLNLILRDFPYFLCSKGLRDFIVFSSGFEYTRERTSRKVERTSTVALPGSLFYLSL